MLSGHAIGFRERSSEEFLLADPVAEIDDDEEALSGKVLYRASFEELAKNHVQCDTLVWFMISLLLVLAWGVGVLMLLYIPYKRYVLQKELSSRTLYVTENKIFYKAMRPSFIPFLGIVKIEKQIPLHLVIDIIIEQVCFTSTPTLKDPKCCMKCVLSNPNTVPFLCALCHQVEKKSCLQSSYGLHTFRIESIARGKAAPVDELQFQGVSSPELLRKVIVTEAAKSIQKAGSRKVSDYPGEGIFTPRMRSLTEIPSISRLQSPTRKVRTSPRRALFDAGRVISSDVLLRKLEEIIQSLKKIESLVVGSRS